MRTISASDMSSRRVRKNLAASSGSWRAGVAVRVGVDGWIIARLNAVAKHSLHSTVRFVKSEQFDGG